MAVRFFASHGAAPSGCAALCPSKLPASQDSHASGDDALSSCTMAQPPAASAQDVTAAAPGKLLQLAISSANKSLERTLQLFTTACSQGVGSAAALAALDAAEASMSHTARLTQLATVLAAGLLARRDGEPPAPHPQATAQPPGGALMMLQQQLAGLAAQCQAAMLAQPHLQQPPELRYEADVEEGEEATSRCSSFTSAGQPDSAQHAWA